MTCYFAFAQVATNSLDSGFQDVYVGVWCLRLLKTNAYLRQVVRDEVVENVTECYYSSGVLGKLA